MDTTIVSQSALVTVIDYRCSAHPGDMPEAEMHHTHSLSYVRRGSFGLRYRGAHRELVPGSILVGHAGDYYCCTHEHHVCGDECLSFQFTPACIDMLDARQASWRVGALPPLAEMMVLGEMGQAAASGHSDLALDEIALMMAARLAALTIGEQARVMPVTTEGRRRAVNAAMWIDDRSTDELDLEQIAAHAGMSPFHFLRLFGRVLGVTPHQYLMRARLRNAAALLAEGCSVTDTAYRAGFNDLSNFVRTFGRAAGVSPRKFQRAAHGERKIFQEKLNRM